MGASHRILIEPGQEPHSCAQRRLEVKRALHCVGGDLLNLSEAARLSSQQINNFVADDCGINVKHDQPLGSTPDSLALDSDIHIGMRRGDMHEIGTELPDIAIANKQLVAHHRETRKPDNAIDVGASVSDSGGGRTDLGRVEVLVRGA